jgi:hypothetical protein
MFAKILSTFKQYICLLKNHPHSNESRTTNMDRIAIDQSGCAGFLYDGCRDTIMGKLGGNVKIQSHPLTEPATCRILKGRTAETQRLLEIVDIDQQLQLSITLKIVQPTGIASLINYPHSIDRYTRFLYFYQTTFIDSCNNDTNIIKKSHQFFISETSATHIITEVVWGVHVIIVLQLSPDHEASIDRLLDTMRQHLVNSMSFEQLIQENVAVLQRITSTTVYSNIPDLTKLTKLDDICQKILRLRGNPNGRRRLKYSLRSIQSLYPEYSALNINYVQFSPTYIESIEDYLLQQSAELKQLKCRIDCELCELLQGTLEEQLNDVRRDFSKIQEQHEKDIKKIQEFILIIRKGQIPDIQIDGQVSLDPSKVDQDRVNNITSEIDALKAKGNLIIKLQGNGFEYRNVVKLGIDQECDQDLIQKLLFKSNPNQIVFCSYDLLKNKFEEEWNSLYEDYNAKRTNDTFMSFKLRSDFKLNKKKSSSTTNATS